MSRTSRSSMKIVFCGLSLSSSWGNGHATTYRGLIRELSLLGHEVLFLERDMPWYAENRDLPKPPYARLELYCSLPELKDRFGEEIAKADVVVIGSFVHEGTDVSSWVLSRAQGVVAFYDIDTPVTVSRIRNPQSRLRQNETEYLSAALVPEFDLYLSFTGGPMLKRIEQEFGARRARALYCSVDAHEYFPEAAPMRWDLGYLGTYSDDRQLGVDRLLREPARSLPENRFVVAGPQYPWDILWEPNVERVEHLPPAKHRRFYCSQRFTLNLTRKDMVRAGYSPSVRLFEAAACATPIISDFWPGLDSIFKLGSEIMVAGNPEHVTRYLTEMRQKDALEIGRRARERVLREHTAACRARELVEILKTTRDEISRDKSRAAIRGVQPSLPRM